ncbi:MAG: endonuclease III [Bacilli bacterium]
MTIANKTIIFNFLDEYYPDVKGELLYSKDYELLIAVVLSAQATDKAVNIVTRKLFGDYPTFETLITVKEAEFAEYFRTLGLFRNKAKHVYNLVQILHKEYKGVVPAAKEKLMTLPGVGIKTANVVRAELFKIPEIAVDTHVSRIAKRLGFADFKDDVTIIEKKLRRRIPKARWIKTHHQMIHFGRYFCKAQSPRCKECPLVKVCVEPNKNL